MSRLFAVIPAAGLSRRMGQPKLLLPWQGRSVIAHLLESLHLPEISCRAVIIHPDDATLRRELQSLPADIVLPPLAPPEMKASVRHGLEWISQTFQPAAEDGWLLIPADSPLVTAELVRSLIARWEQSSAEIMRPVCQGRGGHPVFFRWPVAAVLEDIPPDQGINWLHQSGRFRVESVPVEQTAILADLDTPEDYHRLLNGEGN